MPTPTDLVTDLPADFEVFGQAVDSSMADLLGGTTGQVLAKNSNTNMDFVWVTSDDANAIQNTIVDAKGDLIGATAADTPARLAVGTNGQVLTADSTAATGLAWATPSGGSANVAGKNGVLNSNFSVWQRGTSIALAASTSAANGYSTDRWDTVTGANQAITISRQATSDSTNLPNIQYCARYQRNSGQTGTGALTFAQNFESLNSVQYAGKTVTFSFYGRAGANYSAASSALNVYIWNGTGTDQNVIGAGFTGQNAFINSSATLTTTWQRFTFTAAVPTNATQIATGLSFTPVGTAGANDYFEVTGVQLEIASSASAYSPNAATFQGELAACQRYFYNYVNNTSQTIGVASFNAATQAETSVQLPVTMRTTPTLSSTTGSGYYGLRRVAQGSSSMLIFNASTTSAMLYAQGFSSLTAGQSDIFYSNNSAASLSFSAEL